MTMANSNNKQIAKNTAFLYIRMFVMMTTSLFTSRVVLDALGAADYGIYNVVGGVVVLFSFLNNALLAATQRYLNFNIGQNNLKQTNIVFCMSMNTYFILSLVVLLLGETIGLWFLSTQLNIASERMYAAQWVYQFSLIQFVANLLRIPYNASIIAYERMNFYAYVSLIEVIVKLAVVYLLYITTFDKLIAYSFLYTIIPIIIAYVYKVYCNHYLETTHYHCFWDKKTFKELFGFSGWSLFGSLANLSAQQGLNILINIFYGVTVNAAAGIANQVSANVYGFISNFQTAFQPQIVKSYAANEINRFFKLIFQTSKFSYFMVIILVIPILFTINELLDIWLKDVPEYTAGFCRLILIMMVVEAVSAPLWMSVHATGKIRNYQMLMAVLMFLNLPVAYFFLKFGYSPYSVWYVRIAVNIIVLISRCVYIKYNIGFPLSQYVRQVIMPILKVTIMALPIPMLIYKFSSILGINFILIGLISFVVTLITTYFLGLDKQEKDLINNFIRRKIL